MVLKKTKQKGFTLIELLVVIAIIGLLASTVMVALSNARVRARDAKRKADIKGVISALELYFSDNNKYPIYGADGSGYVLAQALNGASPALSPTYINQVPVDPSPGRYYYYVYTNSGKEYGIYVNYELAGPCKYRTSGGSSGWWAVADCTQ